MQAAHALARDVSAVRLKKDRDQHTRRGLAEQGEDDETPITVHG